ncbi:LysR substrate-binding domain-containing protein [Caballeronia sp. ATUFL_M1_KS5A]|uniref:LysR substrate-binding domain-containing protein n=1 Tax=Caballeronia sp. ATUFL_M1_KS5A TaxID=2921778 RepID=UPI002028F48E|nr:LysR substrate-binding domain-containing protein [Caballeronia sp. ATUFL_M1_KS5A]
MKIQQLRAVREAVRQEFNLTDVALALDSSQLLLNRQIRGLEDELGVDLFVRTGKRLVGMTGVGKTVMPLIERVLQDVESVRRVVSEWRTPHTGKLSIAVTHAHARYMLPQIVRDFRALHPLVTLHLRQESVGRIAEMLINGEVDIGIAHARLSGYPQLVALPCYRHASAILVPHGHALTAIRRPLTLSDLADQPLITYENGVDFRRRLDQAFRHANLSTNIVIGAVTADVIKAYVELGMGVGVVTSLAWDEARDSHHLHPIDAGHLFPLDSTHLGWKQGTALSDLARAFVSMFAPTLIVEATEQSESPTACAESDP